MILVSVPAKAQLVEHLKQVFGDFPIYLTEKNVGLPKEYSHGSLMYSASGLLRGYPKHDKLTVTWDGETVSVIETASEGIYGGARSTGNHEYNAARTADYRGANFRIQNPRLPSLAPNRTKGWRSVLGPVPRPARRNLRKEK